MKARIASFALIALVMAGALMLATRFQRGAQEVWADDLPVDGLVVQDDGTHLFEPVAPQDREMLHNLGFPKALASCHAVRVRHLVIYLDCHYFFIADGRVLVMTLSGSRPTPQLVETKRWAGAPRDFHDYRKELLPST
jgi:hypothetical protein